jgi:glycosyltransferase involved in cell wall biosynthesis
MSTTSALQHHALHGPPVSIGMPVYNSVAWVESAIESILGQTYRDFELIISDNASTDATFAICERYARVDTRIRLLRHATNLGANRNYLTVLHASRGKYFKWAASNDLCAPTFVERCVAALERDPQAVLACPRSWIFERTTADAQPYDRDLELTESDPADRFVRLHDRMGLNNAFNGVVRREAFERASTMGSYMGADIVLMSELALLGKFLLVDDRLFYRRMSPEAATRLKSAREVERHLAPTARGPLRWQAWRFQLGLLKACRLAGFPSGPWVRALNYSLRSFVWARRELASEVVRGLRPDGSARAG